MVSLVARPMGRTRSEAISVAISQNLGVAAAEVHSQAISAAISKRFHAAAEEARSSAISIQLEVAWDQQVGVPV